MLMDTTLGIAMCYLMHQVIEHIAAHHNIDALKSGLYFTDDDPQTDEYIDYRVWSL